MENKLKWEDVLAYTGTLGMQSDPDTIRVGQIFKLGAELCPEVITDIFISNYLDSDAKAQNKDLWLFSNNYVVEALNFTKLPTPTVEITVFNKNLAFLHVETKDFDFSESHKYSSVLHIITRTNTQFGCDFIATGKNCEKLKQLFYKYMKPNMVGGISLGIL
jgi:hypothetical protein